MAAASLRRAWQIHGAVLAALVILYFVVFWDTLFGPPKRGFNLDGFAAAVLMAVGLAYAAVSTVLMWWVGRRIWGPPVMHTLALGAYFLAIHFGERDAREREAELARLAAEAEASRVRHCFGIREARVILGAPLRASLELYNGCDVEVLLDGVDWIGFPPSGGDAILDADGRGMIRIAAHRSEVQLVEARPGEVHPPPDRDWGWRGDVRVAAPESTILCFATPGARGGRGCAPLGRVSIDQR